MKRQKSGKFPRGTANRLVQQQRRLLEEIDRYLERNNSLSVASKAGLEKIGSILEEDIHQDQKHTASL